MVARFRYQYYLSIKVSSPHTWFIEPANVLLFMKKRHKEKSQGKAVLRFAFYEEEMEYP